MAITKRQLKEKTEKTFTVFSDFTDKVLYKLSSQRYFDELVMPIKSGKESVVYLATSMNGPVAVKIYRLKNCDFTAMYNYLKEDPRYFKVPHDIRKITFYWAEREFKNMQKTWTTSINMPKPIVQKFNVLVMGFIGNDVDKTPAPRLKDLDLDENDWIKCADKTFEFLKKMKDEGICHGDLSGFNILYHRKEPYFIDFSQGTLKKNPEFDHLFERDKKNITDFFRTKIGDEVDKISKKYFGH